MANDLGAASQAIAASPRLATIMRPELPSLAEEIITAVRQSVPEYARPVNGPYGEAIKMGVAQALTTFVDLVENPSGSRAPLDRVFRELGGMEAREGRSMDSLQAACRVGTQVAWDRVMRVGQRACLPSTTMSTLAALLFRYIDELIDLAMKGYEEARYGSAEVRLEYRRQLTGLLLERPAASLAAIASLAEQAEWPVPDEITPAVLADGASPGETIKVDEDILTDSGGALPRLLIPGQLTPEREKALREALPGRELVAGVTVPVHEVAHSLRWVMQTVGLIQAGIIDEAPITLCADHLLTILLLSDTALAEFIVRKHLAFLDELKPGQQERVAATARLWLDTRGTAADIASELRVHPQTVRNRLRTFEQAAGERLNEPETRFGIELGMRIMRLRERAAWSG